MISVSFTEDELVEIANHTAFTAFHSLEDDDGETWRVATLAVSILDKLEAAHPALIKAEGLACAREMFVIRRRVACRSEA